MRQAERRTGAERVAIWQGRNSAQRQAADLKLANAVCCPVASQLKRREFIGALGGAAAWPLAARAQQPAMPVIGFLNDGSLQTRRDYLGAFFKGLAETGYIEGRNVAIEYRWAEDHSDRLPALAADLARRRVAVIATPGTTASALAARAATKEIPIVFLVGADPIKAGLVASLNRPGGNVTGVATLAEELSAKRVELLHETVPAATLIAYLGNSAQFSINSVSRTIQAAARSFGLRALTLTAGTPGEIDAAFENLTRQQVGALLLSGDPLFASHRDRIIALAALHRVPTMYRRKDDVAAGGLMSYGTDFADAWRQVGIYTGRILKGDKSADLPVQRSVRVELVINTKTATALGLTLPLTLLAGADELIE
jgi:putative ABC transport system substrate-binding protein